jgi:rare lipoprotein A
MLSSASSSQRKRKSKPPQAQRGKAASRFAVAIILLCGMVWDDIEVSYAAINVGKPSDLKTDAVVLPLAQQIAPVDIEPTAKINDPNCSLVDAVNLALLETPVTVGDALPPAVGRQTGHDMLNAVAAIVASAHKNSMHVASSAQNKLWPRLGSMYRSLRKYAAVMDLARIQSEAALTRATIVGVASTYNPFREGKIEGDVQTASGEPYDVSAWTAAIQMDLRNQFGGVRFGRLYQPAYALVESGNKQVIVKVNDVGRLRPGRVLDLNERTMRYFDPFMTRGLLDDVRITFLPGDDWTPGPLGAATVIDIAAVERRTGSPQFGTLPSNWQTEVDLGQLRMPLPDPMIEQGVRAEAKTSLGG